MVKLIMKLSWSAASEHLGVDGEPVDETLLNKVVTQKVEDLCTKAGVQKWEEKAVQLKWQRTRYILQAGMQKPIKQYLLGEQLRPAVKQRDGRPKNRWSHTFRTLLGNGWQYSVESQADWDSWTKLSIESLVEAISS